MSVLSVDEQVRSLTNDEVEFFRANGWVKLDQLVNPDLAAEALNRFKALMAGPQSNSAAHGESFLYYAAGPDSDPLIHDMAHSRSLAAISADLLGERTVRLWSATALCKLGHDKEQSTATNWHQDFPTMSIDRAICNTTWVALDEVTPEMGGLRYLNGSQHERPIGRLRREAAPEWIFDKYEMSPPFHMNPGDAFIHDSLTIHGAEKNESDRDRWAWTSTRIGGSCKYNGAKSVRTDLYPQVVDEYFDDKFPVLID